MDEAVIMLNYYTLVILVLYPGTVLIGAYFTAMLLYYRSVSIGVALAFWKPVLLDACSTAIPQSVVL
jgi:hypothetical protein